MSPTARNTLLGIAAISAALLGYFVAWGLHTERTKVTTAAPFEFPGIDGKTYRLADWRGKLVLINFWATWCPPCREEIPLLMRAQDQYGANGLQILGIAVDDREAVLRYADSIGISYPILLSGDQGFELMRQYTNTADALPYSVLISPQGEVLNDHRGVYTEPDLIRLISANLPASSQNRR